MWHEEREDELRCLLDLSVDGICTNDPERLKAWQKEHHWHPHQLRHTAGTKTRKLFGLEAAQAHLGHSKADVTPVYAERNLALAREIAAKIG